MTESAPDGAKFPSLPSTPRPRFSILLTAVCSIVVAVYIGLPVGPLLREQSPLAQIDQPVESLQRLVTRQLDLDEAMRRAPRWQWRLYWLLNGGDDPREEARTWYEELVGAVDSDAAELGWTILLAEAGETKRAQAAVADWRARGPAGARMADWVRAAYLARTPGTEAAHAAIGEIRETLESDWFADTLVERIAARIGDASARAQANAAILARGTVLLARLRLLWALVTILLVGGAVALVLILARGSTARVADAPLPPDWSTADGYALFVRALGAPQAIVLTAFFLFRRASPFDGVVALAADLPVFLWVIAYLRARGGSIRAAFGFVPRRDGWAPLLGTTLILIAAALVGDAFIDTSGTLLGLRTHWADGFSEDLLWDSRWALVTNVFTTTVWAPVIEELTFRGLLYATLRTRLGVAPAALLSAVVFALPHGYAAAGSLSVLMSGVLWAVAYERTRSLLPGLLAHSANNVMSTLWVVALLRA
jgi:uncharacterized protein